MDCTGKRIAYTGTSMQYDRQEVYSAITAAKGEIDYNSVTSKTDLLVIGDQNPEGSKYKNAQKHGTPTVSVRDFMARAYDGTPWSFPVPTQRAAKQSQRARAKADKTVAQAVRQMARETPLSGFVGF